MKAAFAALIGVFAPFGATASAADVWHLYSEDPSFAFLAVVDETEVDEAEAYYPFSMDCSDSKDWTIDVAGLDHVKLGEAIARGEPPAFSILFDGKADETYGQFYPDLNFGEMWGEWEYVSTWPSAILDLFLAANEIRVKGPGVDMVLPSQGQGRDDRCVQDGLRVDRGREPVVKRRRVGRLTPRWREPPRPDRPAGEPKRSSRGLRASGCGSRRRGVRPATS